MQKSLKIKCLKIVALSVTAIMVVFSIVNVLHERQELEQRLEKYANLSVSITSQAVATPVWNIDEESLNDYLAAFEENPDFCGANITDKQGSVLAQSKQQIQNKNSLIVTHPILFKNEGKSENLGMLTLCFSRDHIQQAIIKNIAITAFAVSLLLGLVLYAVFYSVGIITRPLDAIRAAISKVAENMEKIMQPELNQSNEIGEVTKAFNLMIDDLVSSRTALVEAKDKAETANKLKTEFLASVSHELRTPLNSILVLTEDMKVANNQNLTSEQIETLSIIHKNGGFLLGMINDLLDFAKIEAGKTTLHIENVDMQSFMMDIRQLFQSQASSKKVGLHFEKSSDMPDIMQTDKGKLTQIIRNLVSNALKFTAEGEVRVKCYRTGLGGNNAIAVSVSDSGIGIPKDKIELIFQSFQQVDGAIARKYGGTGLGLAISKALSKLLGGRIQVESIEGKGSTFTLFIPEIFSGEGVEDVEIIKDLSSTADTDIQTAGISVAQQVKPGTVAEHSEVSQPALSLANNTKTEALPKDLDISRLKGKRVLVVERNMRDAFKLSKILTNAGITAYIATEVEKIAAYLQGDEFIDVMLVNMDTTGHVIELVRQDIEVPLPPIIALLEHADKTVADKQEYGGIKRSLTKPIDTRFLMEVLLQCVRPSLFGVGNETA